MLIRLTLLAISAVCTGGVLLSHQTAIIQQLDRWQLVPQPERFTELYFSDYHRLPTLSQGGSQLVHFTIHNLEHRTTTYRYDITAQVAPNDVTRSLGSGTLRLAHNQPYDVTRTVSVPPLGPRIMINVALNYQGSTFGGNAPVSETQSVHYWLADPQMKQQDGL